MITISLQFDNLDALHEFTLQLAKRPQVAEEQGSSEEFKAAMMTAAIRGSGSFMVTEVNIAADKPQEVETTPLNWAGNLSVPDATETKAKPGRPKKNLETVVPATPKPAAVVTLDDVRGVLMAFNTKFGLQALGAKLKAEFNTGGIKGLKPEQYADVIASFTVGK